MAINKKGSRKIVVEDKEFRWRATGSDKISVVIWAVENEDSRLIGSVDYHHKAVKNNEGHYSSQNQLIVTNRMIREIILHYGVQKIIANQGQINIGDIENIYHIENAVKS